MTNGWSSDAARLAEGSAAMVSSAVPLSRSDAAFRRMGGRSFMKVETPVV
jgi:hypothetical protein